ncbi:TetR/AcrR family transcriptional regulator [uncultured Pseudomonas sp.]|uniref:TetR/AcrR family transcriptional regulator n=1 Tax=uncultured Pseudomonas sp. TaxID=114707 RepID=UPI002616F456|nr:TetR/AcrR family transcriptional regulator [uncultured Pseudomonas sp.]
MRGLREKQKEQRKEAILVAAMSLFDSHGYSATTVEQIAAAAGVSPPTVFNYFGNKQEIIFALVDRADRSAIHDIRSRMATFDNAVDALCNLQAAVMRYELEALPIPIWRDLMSLSVNGSSSAGMVETDKRLVSEIAGLLRELQGRGMLSAGFDPETVADFLNDYAILLFARFVHQDEPDEAAHALQVRRVAELVFTGLRP